MFSLKNYFPLQDEENFNANERKKHPNMKIRPKNGGITLFTDSIYSGWKINCLFQNFHLNLHRL